MVSLPAGSRLGRYQIVTRIGRGGMASVYRAHDPDLNRQVAVKVLPSFEAEDPTFVERFRLEAQAVARLNHPNIIQIHDVGEDKGFTYIVMEYITGGTFQDIMGRRIPLAEALSLITPLATALDYAHSQGIIHRDIKPANVLLDDDGSPKLSDFGLARLLEGSAGLTRADSVLGTPEYMAPDQAMGSRADHKSDLYALGIIVYQMLLGQTPFRGETPSETLMAHIHQDVPLPTAIDPDIDLQLEAILLRALAKEPDDRHESAGELAQALASVEAEAKPDPETYVLPAGETSTPPLELESRATVAGIERLEAQVDLPPPPRVAEPAERRRGIVLVAVAVGVLIGIAGLIAGLFITGVVPPERKPDASTLPLGTIPAITVKIVVVPEQPARLVSQQGDVVVDLDSGAVDEEVDLFYEPLVTEEAPPEPQGFLPARKVFDISVAAKTPEQGPVALNSPVTITVSLSTNDIQLAGGEASNIVIQHHDDAEGRWAPLVTDVDLASAVAKAQAQAQADSLSIFGLYIKDTGQVPTPQPPSGLIAAPAPVMAGPQTVPAAAGDSRIVFASDAQLEPGVGLTGEGQWEQVAPFTADDLRDVQFVNENIGFAAGNGAIYRTEDGGETWERVEVGVVPGAVAAPDISLDVVIVRTSGLDAFFNGAVGVEGGEITRVFWVWGDGSSNDSLFPAEHTYPGPGTYNLRVTAFDDLGRSKTITRTIVFERPAPTLTPPPTPTAEPAVEAIRAIEVNPPAGTTLIAGQAISIGAVMRISADSQLPRLVHLYYEAEGGIGGDLADVVVGEGAGTIDERGMITIEAPLVVPNAAGMTLIAELQGPNRIIDSLSPNPPKDTDGRREDSGRGWVRELQGRWPGVLG